MKTCKEKKRHIKTKVIILLLAGTSLLFISLHASKAHDQSSKKERLIDLMNKTGKRYRIPALAVAVITNDAVLEQEVVGVRDITTEDKAQIGDRFHLGSNTKNITAFVAAKLVEQGVIRWDTRFFDLLPELKSDARPCYHLITLEDLLSHRAFVQPHSFGGSLKDVPELKGDIHEKRVGFARYVLMEKPKKPLVDKYKYSNAGYVLAAVMLEEASGKSWEELVNSFLKDDLHLDVGFGWPIEYGDSQPRGHMPGLLAGGKGLGLVPYEYEVGYIDDEVNDPAGSLNMSIMDWSKYIQLHLQGLRGEDNYLKADTYEFMHFGLPEYSMGWRNKEKKGKLISWHDGSAGNFLSHVYIVKDRDLAVAILANSGVMDLKTVIGVYQLRKKIVNLYTE
jgi:D-alanyl-D-alanine carboxypeptidase